MKKLVKNPKLVNEVIELKQFKPLIFKVKKIQSSELSAKDQIKIITELKQNLRGFEYASSKLNKSLSKNPDFKDFEEKLEKWQKYSPLTTVELERNFSCLNSMLTDRRMNLTEDNIEKYHFIKYNQFLS